jgi:hypothetical protein
MTETIVTTNPAPAPGTTIVQPPGGLPPVLLLPGVPVPAGTSVVSSTTGLGSFVLAAEELAVAMTRTFLKQFPHAQITFTDTIRNGSFLLGVGMTSGRNYIGYTVTETAQSVSVYYTDVVGAASEMIVAQQNGQGSSFSATGNLLSLATLVSAVPQLPLESTANAQALLAKALSFSAAHPGAQIVFSKTVGATDSFNLSEVSGKSQFGFNL